MAETSIHGKKLPYSALNAVEAIARALSEIRIADKLTFADLGAVLGRSEDSASKYCDGSATMDAVTFGRGKKEWGSRFTGYFDRLCDGANATTRDRDCETSVIKVALALSEALAGDNKITAEEIRHNRATIEEARDALGALLSRLRVAA